MKNKIAVWCALFALMVALVPPSSAKANTTEITADDVKYRDIEDFMHSMGYTDFTKVDNALYMVFMNTERLYVVYFEDMANYMPYCVYNAEIDSSYQLYVMATRNIDRVYYLTYYAPDIASQRNDYKLISSSFDNYNKGFNYNSYSVQAECLNCNFMSAFKLEKLVYSDLAVFHHAGNSTAIVNGEGTLVFEATTYDGYSFPVWCDDAGLNCLASSNESPTKIPYSYNSCWHIVRKTSSGKWLLTTVGNSVSQENASDYTFVYSEDMSTLKVLNLYSGEDTNGYLLNVRQYEYDTDGWKVRTYETYDARETEDNYIDLGAGSGVDDTRVMAYTNVDIYNESFEVVTPASTEYAEPSVPEVTPEPTPDVGSGGGSSDTGGTGSDGGGTGGGTRPETNVDLGVDLDDITLEDIPETIKNIKDTIKEFLGLVGVVPLMIGAVFGFLPDWCLWVLGVSFAFVGILLIVKLIRG